MHKPDDWTSERVLICRDSASGLLAAIAIDDTTLGPGLGGVRFRRYPSVEDGVAEARRLAAAMTLKNALAGLPYGGAKSVIFDGGQPSRRAEQIRAFGSHVAQLAGDYVPGVDMGTTGHDLDVMASMGAEVTCAQEDPSPWTALGTFEAIRAAISVTAQRDDLIGVRVAIQGAGHVGASLAKLLAEAGAQVLVSDIDPARAREVADSVGGEVVAPQDFLTTECDVLAPCAVARVLTPETIPGLRSRVVAGAANDMLDTDECAELLQSRGITYVPDFLTNAGGVIHIHGLSQGWSTDRLDIEVRAIGDRVRDVLVEANSLGVTPFAAARAQAERRIEAARRVETSARRGDRCDLVGMRP